MAATVVESLKTSIKEGGVKRTRGVCEADAGGSELDTLFDTSLTRKPSEKMKYVESETY